MDIGDGGGFDDAAGVGGDFPEPQQKKRVLPDDLPKSLDDRKLVPTMLVPETEMYDGWQGWSLLPHPVPKHHLASHPALYTSE
jgi:hypothetical protein